MMPGKKKYTEDSLFDGSLQCVQHSRGYRFSLDAVLLGNFIALRPKERILDLGSGSGIVSLILAYRWPSCHITGLEIQPELVELARKNVTLNGWQDRVSIQQGDLRQIDKFVAAGEFDRVVSNPPYRKSGSGRMNIEPEQLLARHEIMADINAVVKAAAYALKNKGRTALIFPAARTSALLFALKNQGLEPKRLQVVYSFPGSTAALVLVEAVKGGGEEMTILPPFYVYTDKEGGNSPEMAACYKP